MTNISDLHFARCFIPEEYTDGVMELHHFCDASESGYGACSFLTVINREGKIRVILVASKARLAPLKPITVPRLELLAAVTAVKLECVIKRELEIPLLQSTFWTDSLISMAYIQNNTRRFKTFVANRISFIREHSSPNQWYHICGKENPADVLSRGCCADRFPAMWLYGPPFLSEYKSMWPVTSCPSSDLLEGDLEIKQRNKRNK